jgi:oligopeptide transport system substrate-binding protein
MLNKKWSIAFAIVVIGTLVLSACAQPTPEVIEREVEVTRVVEKEGETVIETAIVTEIIEVTPEPTAAPEEPVTLHWNLGGEPPQVDPALSTDTTSVLVDEQLFLGLTDFDDETSEVIPELATSWEANEDGTVWTFYMRDDVPWVKHNPATGETAVVTDEEGNPVMVTAHDVENAVKRTLNPETGSDYAYVLYIIEGALDYNSGEETDPETVGVKALDDYTVEFTLRQPAGYFPGIASMWVARPVYQPIIDEWGARWIEPGYIVTNGPYVMDEWAHEDHMTLIKNPHFYDADSVQIERVYFTMVNAASTAMAMYENNELDNAYPGPPLEEMDRIKEDPVLSQEFVIAPRLCTYYYGFTNNKPPFDDPLVRKAFSAAIDRVSLIENVTKGGQLPANTFAPEGIFGNVASDPEIAPWALDPEMGKEMAAEWLAEAGYPGGEGFPVVTLMHNTSEGHRSIAEAIQAMWRETLGVEVEVTNQEWGVYLETLKSNTPLDQMPQVWRLGWCADYADNNNWVHEVFNCEEGANRLRRNCVDATCSAVEPSEFDELTAQAGRETDPEVRLELYREAERILVEEEAAYAPIYYYTNPDLTKPWLNRTYQQLGGQHFDKWTIDWEAKQAATQ